MTAAKTAAMLDQHHAAGTITTREHEALTLRFVNKLSTRQLAASLGVTRTTARDLTNSGLRKIARKELAA